MHTKRTLAICFAAASLLVLPSLSSLRGENPQTIEVISAPSSVPASSPATSQAAGLSDKQIDQLALDTVNKNFDELMKPYSAMVKRNTKGPSIEPVASNLVHLGGQVMTPNPLKNWVFRCATLGYGTAAPARIYIAVSQTGEVICPFTLEKNLVQVLANENLSKWTDADFLAAAQLYMHLTTLASQDGWKLCQKSEDFMAIQFNMPKQGPAVEKRVEASKKITKPTVTRDKDKVVVKFCAWQSIMGRLQDWTIEFAGKDLKEVKGDKTLLGAFGGGGYD